MTPEKFFDYLEGKLPPAEKERFERALISDPELQQQFARAREVHRGLERSGDRTTTTARAGNRGRQLAAAFAVLVAMNVALGLIYIFKVNKPNEQVRAAQKEALRHQLQASVEKAAAATFTPPSIGPETITLPVAREKMDTVAQSVIDAATRNGGSATKGLPEANGLRVLVQLPAKNATAFRTALALQGGPSPAPTVTPAPSPDEMISLEVLLTPSVR